MTPGVGIGIGIGMGIGLNGLGLHNTHHSLIGAGYDGKDPRVRLQLERTGLEYLVVRRHQDPVSQALKRLPGMGKNRRIPRVQRHSQKDSDASVNTGAATYGSSQSMRDARGSGHKSSSSGGEGGARSFEGTESQGERSGASGASGERGGEDGIGAILRGLWEKGYDLSASTD